VPGVDVGGLYPPDHFEDYEGALAEMRDERREYLAQFEALSDDIKDAVY
jgi:phosphoenolpyruvate carboxykinase (ATP)